MTHIISGTHLDPELGGPIKGATVMLYNNAVGHHILMDVTETDENGYWEFRMYHYDIWDICIAWRNEKDKRSKRRRRDNEVWLCCVRSRLDPNYKNKRAVRRPHKKEVTVRPRVMTFPQRPDA